MHAHSVCCSRGFAYLLLLTSQLLYIAISHENSAAYRHGEQADIRRAGGRIRGLRKTSGVDFVLGGLFPIHTDSENGSRCGRLLPERGVERMEAMLYAIDLINNDTTLLPNVTLGFDIRDTCNSETTALDESLELVFNGQRTKGNQSKSSCAYESTIGESSASLQTSAVIGAAASQISVPVASLMRLFRIPQVSYASSTARLNNRESYEYFYRTVPADDHQVRAMVKLALHFNWTYISIIYAKDFYGADGAAEFRRLANQYRICVDFDQPINSDYTAADYQRVASGLLNSSANVVILFASKDIARRLFTALYKNRNDHRQRTSTRFLWIASDAWADSDSVAREFNESVTGIFGIVPQTDSDAGFDRYFTQLTLSNNRRNPWFGEFCKIRENCSKSLSITDSSSYEQGVKIPSVINAVYSIAHALNNFLNDNCKQPLMWHRFNRSCVGQKRELNGSVLVEYVKNVSFISSSGRQIKFDANGNVEGLYNILNYQQTPQGYQFVQVGKWARELQLNSSLSLQFGLENGIPSTAQESHCTWCGPGKFFRAVEGSCCGTCDLCLGRDISKGRSNSECQQCEKFAWGNNPLQGSDRCINIKESYLRYGDSWSIALLIIASFGLIACGTVLTMMIVYWNTVIIKSSSREQMLLLLSGLSLCFLVTIVFVSKPSTPVCFFQRAGLWTCFSIVLGSLLIKLIRIARIFLRRQFSAQLKLMGAGWQILFTFIVITGQLILVAISFAVVHPVITRHEQFNPQNSLDFPTVILTCASPHTAMLILLVLYDTAIIIACNALAIVTIRFPDNFNEAKYVAFSTFALGLIWLAFIPTYFATSNEARTAVVSFALNMSALAVLMCMFGPRLLVIIVCPERNTIKYMRSTIDEKTRSSPDSTETTWHNGKPLLK